MTLKTTRELDIFYNEHRDLMKKIEIEPETIPYNVEINAFLGLKCLIHFVFRFALLP